MRFASLVVPFILLAGVATAQPAYIDHRTYPADFNTIRPGDAVADRPGYVWRHDGKGWYQDALNTTPSAKRFENGLDWVCFAFEDTFAVHAGGHPAVVLLVDKPATATADRQICLGLEKP